LKTTKSNGSESPDARCDYYSGFPFSHMRKPRGAGTVFWHLAQPYRWAISALSVVLGIIGAISVYFVFVLVWNGWSAGMAKLGSSRLDPSWFLPIVVPAATAIEVLRRNFRKKARRFVYERNRNICTNCGYDLAGLPIEHVCPECGESYNIQKVHDQWDAWFGMGGQKARAVRRR
jgi:hypothetical protein